MKKTSIDTSVKLLLYLRLCNQNVSDLTSQIVPLCYSGLTPLQVTETKFQVAEAVMEVIGLCNHLRRDKVTGTTDVHVIRSPSPTFIPGSLCKGALFFQANVFLNGKTEGGAWGYSLKQIFTA